MAWNLRRLRLERGLSQESLAVDADVDRTYISGIERETFNPTIDVLDRLAAALSINVPEFLSIPNPETPSPEPLKRGRRPAG